MITHWVPQLLASALLAAEPALPSLKEVMNHLDDLYRAKSSHATMKMKIVTEFFDRELTLESWSKGDDEALVVVRAPARESGTATLRSKDGLWSYAARADRLIRIPTGMLSESWMGSHLTNEDLVRDTDYDKDYESALAWVDEGGKRLLRVEMTPRPDTPIVYSKLVYLLDADGWLPYRMEAYDKDKVVRTTTFSNPKTVAGRKVPMLMKVVPAAK